MRYNDMVRNITRWHYHVHITRAKFNFNSEQKKAGNHNSWRLATVGVVIMHLFQNLNMWASGYDYIANPKTFSLLVVFSSCPTAITKGMSKCPGPLYRSKIKVSQSTPCGYSKFLFQDA